MLARTEYQEYTQAQIELQKGQGILDSLSDKDHEKLLEYLRCRLERACVNRDVRLRRYARIDRLISTWQKLSPEDSKREQEEDNTGKLQGIPMNLPLLITHLEDMQAFFSEVFSSESRDFYIVPKEQESDAAAALAEKMNRDTKARKFYKELCLGIRSLIKYNIGGFQPRWEEGGGQGHLASPGNRVESIDMWNYVWDNTVADVSKIPTEAEFAARFTVKNRMWLQKRAMRGQLQRIDRVLDGSINSYADMESHKATFYRNPPSHAGLTSDGQDEQTTSTNSVNWDAWGAGLESDVIATIGGFEVIEMYCWIQPKQFKLDTVGTSAEQNSEANGVDAKGNGYQLWRFVIVDSCQVCSAEPVVSVQSQEPEIPHYIGYMTQDDIKEAQRSVMELMKGFQRFGSFLANVTIAGYRKNIWGTKVYDPSMIDVDRTKSGDVAQWIPSKQPGRDVRTGVSIADSDPGVDKSMAMLGSMMQLMQQFFPSQGLPSQVAGIDRAVKNQVAALMQGAVRRLHMTARILDSDIFMPLRLQMYRNLSMNDSDGLTNLDEEAVAAVLGSGIQQLNAEATASEVKEILYAVLQNPEAASLIDVVKLITYWSRLMNMPSDLADFAKQPQVAQQIPGAPAAGQAPEVLGASGLAAAPAATVPAV